MTAAFRAAREDATETAKMARTDEAKAEGETAVGKSQTARCSI